MNFIKRLLLYCKNAGSFRGIFSFAFFAFIRNHPLTSDKKIKRVIHALIPFIQLHPKNFNGNSILLDTGNFSHFIIADEFIVDKIYDLHKINFKPDIIYDCGAHIGLFSVLADGYFPGTPIYSFEPLPANYQMIEKQVAVNSIDTISVEKAAVSTKEGSTVFFTADSSFGGALQPGTASAISQASSIKVRLIDLGQYLDAHYSSKVLLKIDIEGEEENVIPHIITKLPKTCAIFFETHSQQGKEDVYGCLKGADFFVEEIRNVGKYSDHFALR